MTAEFPQTGRIAGVDYGTVRIGVALTDPARSLASPAATYQRQSEAQDGRWFEEFARREQVVGFVVGLPVHVDGRESQKSREARAFADWLGKITKLPVCLFDERYSSVEAEAILNEAGFTSKRRKERRDRLAAQMLLAAYLESGSPTDPPEGLEDR